jgi:hypothetical protein
MTADDLNWTWRFLLTTLGGKSLTFLDRVATTKTVKRTLNKPGEMTGRVASDDPRINLIPAAPIDPHLDPVLSMNSRLLYAFRHEPGTTPWKCKGSGICHILEDEGLGEQGYSHFTAYDAWQRLMALPVTRSDGKLPTNGLSFRSVRGDIIAINLVTWADAAWSGGDPTGYASHIDYGQTAFYAGHVDNTDIIDMHFDQGTSVGDAWTKLTEQGFDIVLQPIYDPMHRPGFLAELNIYQNAGTQRNAAVFGWDKGPRNLVRISRLKDGTKMANEIIYFTGQGTLKGGGYGAATESDAGSQAKYGVYAEQKALPGQVSEATVDLIAIGELGVRKFGGLTLSVDVAPERGPIEFNDYDLGDTVPLYASNRLRYPISHLQRVYEIPVTIGEDGRGAVTGLLLSDPTL